MSLCRKSRLPIAQARRHGSRCVKYRQVIQVFDCVESPVHPFLLSTNLPQLLSTTFFFFVLFFRAVLLPLLRHWVVSANGVSCRYRPRPSSRSVSDLLSGSWTTDVDVTSPEGVSGTDADEPAQRKRRVHPPWPQVYEEDEVLERVDDDTRAALETIFFTQGRLSSSVLRRELGRDEDLSLFTEMVVLLSQATAASISLASQGDRFDCEAILSEFSSCASRHSDLREGEGQVLYVCCKALVELCNKLGQEGGVKLDELLRECALYCRDALEVSVDP